ncbi:AbrB/MazE/SpoVT family DNA-binding domain-containing protein [Solidesulfovibrio magneticus]|uniref:PemI-like protein 1 n=1 Tax=Solidesulfovibrio magneticus (strain ATCC 700980 / DSM 13731 / RS-1) TaxID=573370 RepID=C4XLS8_SOLM1|nr:AbrB/MazE/SpoVT family DNA-binding domain-containing protein [Solidesulfovibrio magneticus]BAH74666.1 PemI-like protein 1 [Solidesulfovibrio magneticus RS-1]
METVLAKWGNSLGVRIPKGMAADAGLDAGDAVSITQSAEGIVIKKAQPKPQYRLADLVSQITDENRHEATEWGDPMGREIW